MDKPLVNERAHARATPKDFFLWAGAMVALYGGVVAFLALIFDYLNYSLPDTALSYYGDPYGSISYEMASLIVLAPVALLLMRFIRRDIVRDPSRADIWVRRWALFLTLFVAGATIVVDLIVLLTTFLSGEELSLRFILKVLVVLLVAGGGFMHFMADVRGYWAKYPARARYVNWGVALLVLVSIIAGFFIVGSPATARQYRLDEQRVQDLQSIQWQVVSYYQQKQKLPASLAEVNDTISGYMTPNDPTGQPYGYRVTGSMAFELCANFAREDRSNMGQGPRMVSPAEYGVNDNWKHGEGRQCFARTIDPERYPPLNK